MTAGRRLGLILSAAIVGSSAAAADLVFGAFDFEPYFIVDQDSFALTGGLWAEQARQLFAEAGFPFIAKGYPVKRLYRNVATGETNVIFGTLTNQEYAGKALFSKEPIQILNLNVYFVGKTEPVDSIEALSGKSVAVIRGYSYGGLIVSLKEQANVQEISSDEGGLAMLVAGRASYFLDYAEGIEPQLASHPIPDLNHHMISKVPIHIVISKATPDADEVARRLDEAYSRLPRK